IIVTILTDTKRAGMILAHEFGHRTGLPHRSDTNALMACEVKVDGGQISPKECKCFRGGPGSCPDDPPGPAGKSGIVHLLALARRLYLTTGRDRFQACPRALPLAGGYGMRLLKP